MAADRILSPSVCWIDTLLGTGDPCASNTQACEWLEPGVETQMRKTTSLSGRRNPMDGGATMLNFTVCLCPQPAHDPAWCGQRKNETIQRQAAIFRVQTLGRERKVRMMILEPGFRQRHVLEGSMGCSPDAESAGVLVKPGGQEEAVSDGLHVFPVVLRSPWFHLMQPAVCQWFEVTLIFRRGSSG